MNSREKWLINRPYEVGDMVIIKKVCYATFDNLIDPNELKPRTFLGVIRRVDKYRFCVVPHLDSIYEEDYYMLDTLRCSANKKSDINKVVCVRRRRKGTPESRAIVARLARDYHKIFLHNLYHHRSEGIDAEKKYWAGIKSGERLKTTYARKVYLREKGLLE